jgi:hypothetical protein
MSRKIQVKIGTNEGIIEGSYETEFRAPLILSTCQHLVRPEKKGLIKRKELWYNILQCEPNGSVSFKRLCQDTVIVKIEPVR